MKITILGLNHEVQWKDTKERDLEKALGKLLKKSQFELIAEEAYNLPTTVGNRLAYKFGIPWLQIDMNHSERKEAGIDPNKRRKEPIFNNKDCSNTVGNHEYYCPEIDDPREIHWINRLDRQRVTTVLVVCGGLHVRSLTKRLDDLGHQVERLDVWKADWFKAAYGIYKCFEQDDGRHGLKIEKRTLHEQIR